MGQLIGADGGNNPVCRWLQPSIDSDALLFAEIDIFGTGDFERVIWEVAQSYTEMINGLSACSSRKSWLFSLTVLLNGGYDFAKAEEILQSNRPGLLLYGLMIGHLGPKSRLKSLVGTANCFPYRTSERFLTVRSSVKGDEKFVDHNEKMRDLLTKFVSPVKKVDTPRIPR